MRNGDDIKYTFFNFIGTADIERIHSAVIGWILSDKCEVFSIKEKSHIIHELFAIDSKEEYEQIVPILEYDHIDIVLKTIGRNGTPRMWIIENKIKSSQGKIQLDQYSQAYPEAKCLLLSLIGEEPNNKKWGKATYADISKILSDALQKAQRSNDTHKMIIEEYLTTINSLNDVVDKFIDTPKSYANVFNDGSKKKSEKQTEYKNEICKYISLSNLETILQKLYFTKIKEEIKRDFDGSYKWQVSETHGNGELVIIQDTDNARFDISFQNGTFKFAVSKDYEKKNKDEKFIKYWEGRFQKIVDERKYDYSKLHQPRSRTRISVTTAKKNNWWKEDFGKVCDFIKEEFKRLPDLIDFVQKCDN